MHAHSTIIENIKLLLMLSQTYINRYKRSIPEQKNQKPNKQDNQSQKQNIWKLKTQKQRAQKCKSQNLKTLISEEKTSTPKSQKINIFENPKTIKDSNIHAPQTHKSINP